MMTNHVAERRNDSNMSVDRTKPQLGAKNCIDMKLDKEGEETQKK